MRKFLAPNLDRTGRLIRGGMGMVFLVLGALLGREHPWAGLGLLAYAAFALFEAARGWCIVRACGIKTRW